MKILKEATEDVIVKRMSDLEDKLIEIASNQDIYIKEKKREGFEFKEALSEYEKTDEYKMADKISQKKAYWQNMLNKISPTK